MARKKQKTIEEIKKGLEQDFTQEFARWKTLYTEGGQDPFWSDGVNLNLVRNHILYAQRRCEEELPESDYPELYYADVPPEVDNNYMTKADEIRQNAKTLFADVCDNENYKWLLSVAARPEVQKKETKNAMYVLSYVRGLEQAINSDNLVDMRRYTRFNLYDQLSASRAKVSKILDDHAFTTDKNGQLSLFM